MLHGVDWKSATVCQGRHIGSFEGWTDMFYRNAYNKLPTYVASHSGIAWLIRRRKFEIQVIYFEFRSETLAAVSIKMVFCNVDWQTHMNILKKAALTFQKAQSEFRTAGL
jgi:hypothetical protein